MFSNAFTNLWQGRHSCLCNQGFTLILIHSCFALFCTLRHAECNISWVFSAICFTLMEITAAGRAPASRGICWTSLGFCFPSFGREELLHTISFRTACYGQSLFSWPLCTPLVLGINVWAHQNPALAFYKVFWEPSTESVKRKTEHYCKKSLL